MISHSEQPDIKPRSYYECHITLVGDPNKIKPLVENGIKWKFSCIDGDPVLGDGKKCYATTFFTESVPEQRVLDLLIDSARWLAENGCTVIRRKIERVIYDDRSKSINFDCQGGCKSCHLDDLTVEPWNHYG